MQAQVVTQLTVLAEQLEILAQPVTQVTLVLTALLVQVVREVRLVTQVRLVAQATQVITEPVELEVLAEQLVHQATLVV